MGVRRHADQTYLEWIITATRKALKTAAATHAYELPIVQKKLKWSWAGHVARSDDKTWIHRTTFWRDSVWQKLMMTSGIKRPLRPSRRRWTKWEDSVRRICDSVEEQSWKDVAKDRMQWQKVGSESLKLP